MYKTSSNRSPLSWLLVLMMIISPVQWAYANAALESMESSNQTHTVVCNQPSGEQNNATLMQGSDCPMDHQVHCLSFNTCLSQLHFPVFQIGAYNFAPMFSGGHRFPVSDDDIRSFIPDPLKRPPIA